MKYVKNVMNLFALALVLSAVSSKADFFSDLKSGASSAYDWAGKHKTKLGVGLGTAAALGAAAYGGKKYMQRDQSGVSTPTPDFSRYAFSSDVRQPGPEATAKPLSELPKGWKPVQPQEAFGSSSSTLGDWGKGFLNK